MTLTRRAVIKLGALSAVGAVLPAQPARRQTTPAPIIVDGHLDFGWNIANFGRDYTRSAADLRAAEVGTEIETIAGHAMVGLPDLLAGQVALLIGMIYVIPGYDSHSPLQMARYDTVDEAESWGWAMLQAIEALPGQDARFRLVRTQADLDAVLTSWQPDQPAAQRHVGIILGMEGADPIRHPQNLVEWYQRGLRSVGLSWGRTRYAGGNEEPGDLTELGAALLVEMARLGMLLDAAHLPEAAFWQAMDYWSGPLVYSHGNVRHFLPTERGLTDDQVRAIVERGGLVGLGVYEGFYRQNLVSAGRPSLDDLVAAVDYLCQLTGNCEHVALGSDADGGFGAELSLSDVGTVADLQKLPEKLALRGYQPADIDAIMHTNWLRVLRRVLPSA
jgi:membrane dipeptidase